LLGPGETRTAADLRRSGRWAREWQPDAERADLRPAVSRAEARPVNEIASDRVSSSAICWPRLAPIESRTSNSAALAIRTTHLLTCERRHRFPSATQRPAQSSRKTTVDSFAGLKITLTVTPSMPSATQSRTISCCTVPAAPFRSQPRRPLDQELHQICSTARSDLAEWAAGEVGGDATLCTSCFG
jgi:hypothetical protein